MKRTALDDVARQELRKILDSNMTNLEKEIAIRNLTDLKLFISPLPKDELFSLFQKRARALKPYYEACKAYEAEHPRPKGWDLLSQWYQRQSAEVGSKFRRNFRKADDIVYFHIEDKRSKVFKGLSERLEEAMRQVIGEESAVQVFRGQMRIMGEKHYCFYNADEFIRYFDEDARKFGIDGIYIDEITRFGRIGQDDSERSEHMLTGRCSLSLRTGHKFKGMEHHRKDDFLFFSPLYLAIHLCPGVILSPDYPPEKIEIAEHYINLIRSISGQITNDYKDSIVSAGELEGE